MAMEKATILYVTENLATPLESFRYQVRRYPTTKEGLDALIHCPKGLEKNGKGPILSVN